MNLEDLNIEVIDLKKEKKSSFRAMIIQTSWEIADWEEIDGLFFINNDIKIESHLNNILKEASRENVDCVIFPELSISINLLNVISLWSTRNNTIVIAGSHYQKKEKSYINTCPIIFEGNCYYSEKINPSPLELSPIGNNGSASGKNIKVFKNTPIGNFAVLICADYLSSKLTNYLIENYELDNLLVPAFQKDSDIYHTKMEFDCRSSDDGIYILYSNNKMLGSGDGKSAAFGLMNKSFFDKLIGYSTDGSKQTKVAELPDSSESILIEFNLNEKKPSLTKTINSKPNIQVFLDGKFKKTQNSKKAKPFNRQHIDSILLNIKINAKSIVAAHGLDDKEWLKALSSQYFLSEIAHELGLIKSDEYNNVIDAFLDFFSLKHDDTIELKNKRILVTPDETERLRQCMIEEDKKDSYFTTSSKTKAENINTQQLHENYLYGVALGISSHSNNKYLNAVQDLALNYLFYKKSPPSKDNHGGWYPYRIPWITARILISISKIDLNERDDKFHILEVIDYSLESLISRITTNNDWRSGVGEWVSSVESTALCLESFLVCDRTSKYKAIIEPIVLNHLNDLQITTIQADFSTELKSNDTLANIIMSSVCIRFIKKYELESLVNETNLKNHLNYCLNVLLKIKQFENNETRQFCTIPQIVSYCLKIDF